MTFYDGKPLEYHRVPTTRSKPARAGAKKVMMTQLAANNHQQQPSSSSNRVNEHWREPSKKVTIFCAAFTPIPPSPHFYFHLSLYSSSFCIWLCDGCWKFTVNVDDEEENLVTLKKFIVYTYGNRSLFPPLYSILHLTLLLLSFSSFLAERCWIAVVWFLCRSRAMRALVTWEYTHTHSTHTHEVDFNCFDKRRAVTPVKYFCTDVIVACRPIQQATIKSTVSTYIYVRGIRAMWQCDTVTSWNEDNIDINSLQ